MRVSGGHLCAQHRSTDRGGSRERTCGIFGFAATLRYPKFCCALVRHQNFDRCAISPSLLPPPAAVGLNAQSKRLLCRKKSSNREGAAFILVEATGFEPAASCSQSKRATKLRHASLCNFQLSVVYITLLFLSTDYGKFKTDVFTFRTHLFSSFIPMRYINAKKLSELPDLYSTFIYSG